MADGFGYVGANTLFFLGDCSYVKSFFLSIEKYVLQERLYKRLNWTIITDRLYRRNIPNDMLDVAIGTMARMLALLDETPLADVNWQDLELDVPGEQSALGKCATLRDFYMPFELGLVRCALAEKFGSLRGTKYRPLRIGSLSTERYVFEDSRPVEQYESNDGDPFWLRDDMEYPNIPVIVQDANDH